MKNPEWVELRRPLATLNASAPWRHYPTRWVSVVGEIGEIGEIGRMIFESRVGG